jgi:protein-tyrosine phosphatase
MKYIDENDIDQIDINLWLGNNKGANDYDNIKKIDIIINFYKEKLKYNGKINYHIPFSFEESSLEECQNIINQVLKILLINPNKKILLCCKAGHHRSANLAIVYLINKYKWNYNKASKHIRSIRRYSLQRKSNLTLAVKMYSNTIEKIFN